MACPVSGVSNKGALPAAPPLPAPYRLPCLSSRRSLYSTESTSACHDASIMLSATPTVPHVSFPSPDVINTRVLAAVAFASAKPAEGGTGATIVLLKRA